MGIALNESYAGQAGDEDLLVDCVRSALARHSLADWSTEPGDFWCYVNGPGGRHRTQGWKLHVSATPLAAPLVLARCAEVLIRHRCAFKFAGTLARVEELVSHRYDRGGGGKFITVYPECDEEQLRVLAEELHRRTLGLPGPGILSDRQYRPGSLVHYRYGAFTGVPILGNDGCYEAMLVAPDGSLVPDARKAWFSPPAWAPRDPLAVPDLAPKPAPDASAPKPVLLDGRYLVHEVIRHAYAGGVYRATDQRTGVPVIIKQARAHAAARVTGQDIRDNRRHEAAMLELLADGHHTPALVGVFEQQGDLFLVQEAVSGVTLRQWVADNTELGGDGTWGPDPDTICRISLDLVELVAWAHGKGLVLRDLNPNNVMVTDAGELRLIDLEMLAHPGDRVVRAYTLGYGAPEQVAEANIGPAPHLEADLYSLGAVLFHLATGVDPILAPDQPATRTHRERLTEWLAALSADNPAARRLSGPILDLLREDPADRPTLADVAAALRRFDPADWAAPVADRAEPGDAAARARRMTTDTIGYLLATVRPDSDRRLWPSEGFGAGTDPVNVQHGAGGILGVLVRAHHSEPSAALRDAVRTVAYWITRRLAWEPRVLPGLHFGRAGTAWAVAEAATMLGDKELLGHATDLARRLPARWPNPDVCHGMAGAGLTHLRFWEITGETDFLDRARYLAEALGQAGVHRDGLVLWPVPRDFPSGLAGLVHYGFAHGVAGIGAFLLAAGRATGSANLLDLASGAAQTLVRVAQVDDGAAYWHSGPDGGVLKTNWCSGSSGVGTFLVRMWQQTGDARLGELAAQAAVAVRRSRWHTGSAQCHGLAGDAEFLLDLAEASGERQYHEWAEQLAASITIRHALRDGRMVPADESGIKVSADYNTGAAGVLALLLRLRDGGDRLWLPESFTGTSTPATGTRVPETSRRPGIPAPADHHPLARLADRL